MISSAGTMTTGGPVGMMMISLAEDVPVGDVQVVDGLEVEVLEVDVQLMAPSRTRGLAGEEEEGDSAARR